MHRAQETNFIIGRIRNNFYFHHFLSFGSTFKTLLSIKLIQKAFFTPVVWPIGIETYWKTVSPAIELPLWFLHLIFFFWCNKETFSFNVTSTFVVNNFFGFKKDINLLKNHCSSLQLRHFRILFCLGTVSKLKTIHRENVFHMHLHFS